MAFFSVLYVFFPRKLFCIRLKFFNENFAVGVTFFSLVGRKLLK